MRVLIVDDLNSNRLLLSDIVSNFGYQCLSVDNGVQAVEVMAQFNPDIVLLDVLMPGLNGFETAPQLKKIAGEVHLPIIFITALDDQDTLLRCLAAGGDDFISKPFASVVLEAKLRAHFRNRELSKSLAEKNQVLAYHSSRVEREHQIVEHIFQNSLARNYLDYPHLHTYLSPMSMFNGDLLLAAPGPLGNLYLFLGDFTGHGLSAAVGALPTSQAFFSMAESGAPVGDIVREVNHRLHDLLPTDMFLAGIMIELSASGERVTYWNGGIPPALLIDDERRLHTVMAPQNLALGILNDNEFDSRVATLSVTNTDSLLLFTDGLIELSEAQGMLGREGLAKLVQSAQSMAQLTALVQQKMSGREQRDDVSMAWLRCKPTGLKPKSFDAELSPLAFDMDLRFYADDIRGQNPVNQVVQSFAAIDGLANFKSQLFTVIQEIYNNAVEHGLLKLDSELKLAADGFERYYQLYQQRLSELNDGWIEMRLSYQPKRRCLVIKVTDSGDGFCQQSSRAKADQQALTESGFGRGLRLVEELTEGLKWSNQGRTIECTLPLTAQ